MPAPENDRNPPCLVPTVLGTSVRLRQSDLGRLNKTIWSGRRIWRCDVYCAEHHSQHRANHTLCPTATRTGLQCGWYLVSVTSYPLLGVQWWWSHACSTPVVIRARVVELHIRRRCFVLAGCCRLGLLPSEHRMICCSVPRARIDIPSALLTITSHDPFSEPRPGMPRSNSTYDIGKI